MPRQSVLWLAGHVCTRWSVPPCQGHYREGPRCYQQPDERTMLSVMLGGAVLQEKQA